jgi:hypothetical protein
MVAMVETGDDGDITDQYLMETGDRLEETKRKH